MLISRHYIEDRKDEDNILGLKNEDLCSKINELIYEERCKFCTNFNKKSGCTAIDCCWNYRSMCLGKKVKFEELPGKERLYTKDRFIVAAELD